MNVKKLITSQSVRKPYEYMFPYFDFALAKLKGNQSHKAESVNKKGASKVNIFAGSILDFYGIREEES